MRKIIWENIDLVNIDAYIQFGEILSICSQDIERKQNYDRMTDNQKSTFLFVCLFGLILYVPINNFFSYVGTGVPGLNQY